MRQDNKVERSLLFLIGASSARFNTQMLGTVGGLLIMDQRKPMTLQGQVAGENFLVFTTNDPQVVEGIRKSRQLQLVLPRSGVVETYSHPAASAVLVNAAAFVGHAGRRV